MKSRLALCLLVSALVSGSLAPLAAQTAYLVQDLVTGRIEGHSIPEDFLTVGNRVFFTALSEAGRELYATDGSPAGTRLLADICPGPCSSDPKYLGSVRGVLLFLAEPLDGEATAQLWRSDGTRQGTFALTGSLYVHFQAIAGQSLFFNYCELGGSGCDLWKTDGTLAGTVRVKDLADQRPEFLVAIGNRVYFRANVNVLDAALWVSDGTEAGTSVVRNFGSDARILDGLTVAAGRIFFVVRGPAGDDEMWASDGTAAGTRAVTAFENPSPFRVIIQIQDAGGEAVFVADDVTHGAELWRSDGTPQGTRRATEIGYFDPFGTSTLAVRKLGGRLVFLATDGIHSTRLWTVGATPESAAPLEGCPGGCPDFAEGSLVEIGGRAVFRGADDAHGFEPWGTDGTAAGTARLRDICPGDCSSNPFPKTLAGAVWFVAAEGSGSRTSLWRTDGTPAGTKRFAGPDPLVGEESFATLGQRVVFAGRTQDYGSEPWIGDGTPAGTRVITDLRSEAPYGQLEGLTAFGGHVFFGAQSGFCERLWRSAGVPGDFVPLTACANHVQGMTVSGGLLYFWYDEGFSDRVWATDGTPEGTRATSPGFNTARGPYDLVPFQGRIYTLIEPGLNDSGLWRMDGDGAVEINLLPEEGTASFLGAVADRLYLATYSPETGNRLSAVNGADVRTPLVPGGATWWFIPQARVGAWDYFAAHTNSGSGESQLWRTDGTAAGTTLVKGGFGSNSSQVPTRLTAHQGSLYFFAGTDDAWGLWKSDGTATGTQLLRSFGVFTQSVDKPVSFGAHLYFIADDGAHGKELWRTDGTPGGTVLVKDVLPGKAGARITDLTVAGGRLFFSAHDGVHGQELWQTDGTAAGTRLVQDVAPMAASSNPADLEVAGDRLFFVADDGLVGRELWALPLAPGAEGCHPSSTALCLNEGRFQVQVSWRDFQGITGTGQAMSLTPDSGYFWFFNPSNVEVVVKVLDGREVNGHQWVFYGALSNVEYTLTVTDTQTGLTRQYFNPMGQFASVGDTNGFGPLGAYSTAKPSPASPAVRSVAPVSAVCQPSATRLCLQNGRFAVDVDWKDFAGKTGKGQAVSLTGDTGTMWFFSAANVELVIKVLDGRELNGHFWIFYGALSSVEYTIKVTDMETGQVRTYTNPSGRLASVGDTSAF